eukprot:6213121-Pleurochrysis_carterae.AAC.2
MAAHSAAHLGRTPWSRAPFAHSTFACTLRQSTLWAHTLVARFARTHRPQYNLAARSGRTRGSTRRQRTKAARMRHYLQRQLEEVCPSRGAPVLLT